MNEDSPESAPAELKPEPGQEVSSGGWVVLESLWPAWAQHCREGTQGRWGRGRVKALALWTVSQ